MQNKLKFVRLVRGIGQEQLAKAVDCDQAIISRIERGVARNTPAIVRTKARIAGFLGLPVEHIFPAETGHREE